jgi:3-dehydroquinate synthase
MRGIPYIQIPTTLLAMVDSSIGGKTGVDTKSGKNLIGTFHQPKEVFIDTDFLKTLPKKEILNGISEMIKHGIILDPYYFKFLDENLEKIIALDETVVKAVKWSCQIKRSVVEKDEKESSLRKILNFGHTIGHAIEKSSTFSVTHGEAVAIGMVAEAKIAVELNLLSRENFDQIANLIKKAGFVISVERLDIDKVIDATRFDKKNSEGKVKYALPDKIGKMKIDVDVPDEIVKKVLGELK